MLAVSVENISGIVVHIVIGCQMWYNGVMAYIRKFKTTSGATGVQVCYKEGNRVVKTVHVGSAGSEAALEKLMREARDIIDAEKGQPMFDLNKFNKK